MINPSTVPSTQVKGIVVVGVEGSAASGRALSWAMDFAEAHGCALDVVTVWPRETAVMVHDVPGHCATREDAWIAQRRLVDQVSSVRGTVPRLERHLVNARPVEALVARSRDRRLLVVGSDRPEAPSRGHTSISARCDRLARCPVMVVRGGTTRASSYVP